MAVDLGDLIEPLKREVSPPGTDLFPNASDDEYVGYLSDALWECVLDGLISGYSSDGNEITPTSGSTDLAGALQQLVVFYAGVRIVRNELRNRNTTFRTAAGSVEFETQQSAQVLKALLDELKERRNIMLARLSDVGAVPSHYVDMVIARTDSIHYGITFEPGYTQGHSWGW